jgi:hypothetical protein
MLNRTGRDRAPALFFADFSMFALLANGALEIDPGCFRYVEVMLCGAKPAVVAERSGGER